MQENGTNDEGVELTDGGASVWQDDPHAGTALELVFVHLDAAALGAAARVCAAWRRAAAEPAAWRAALRGCLLDQGLAEVDALRMLLRMRKHTDISWRSECIRSSVTWRLSGTLHGAAQGEEIQGAALCHCSSQLAVGGSGAEVAVWARGEGGWGGAMLTAHTSLAHRGWLSVNTLLWAPGCDRLLVTGHIALSARWELAILAVGEDKGLRLILRAAVGPGGAAGWAGGRLLALSAPTRAGQGGVTTLWLYSATQETESEHTGVATPLLHLYNEAAAHFSHALVGPLRTTETQDANVDEQYFRDVLQDPVVDPGNEDMYQVVWAQGSAGPGARRGACTALAALRVRARSPPPLHAEGSLAERAARRARERERERERGEDWEEPEPDEMTLRALCEPPEACLPLGGRVLGLTSRGSCVYASITASAGSSGGSRVVVALLPALCKVLEVSAPGERAPPYYLQPAANGYFFGAPAGDGSGRVCLWSAGSGARLPPLPHPAPCVALVLPPPYTTSEGETHTAVVAAGAEIYVWSASVPLDE